MSFRSNIRFTIVIPCYNEAKRFQSSYPRYVEFLNEHPDVGLCLVDDGSKDDTYQYIQQLAKEHPEQIDPVFLEKNGGKAEAVRAGMLHSSANHTSHYIGFLDADLATPFDECLRVEQIARERDAITFAFGSRILKVGSDIQRTKFRFLAGRFVATLISAMLRLKVYDTQCGCKIFKSELVPVLFEGPFISKWLFDVELFFRMLKHYGRAEAKSKMVEVPLKRWEDMGDSKVGMGYFFKLWVDLYRIKRRYRR
ncbi:MAG: glycosyltransferase [Bacteroidota bacterium]